MSHGQNGQNGQQPPGRRRAAVWLATALLAWGWAAWVAADGARSPSDYYPYANPNVAYQRSLIPVGSIQTNDMLVFTDRTGRYVRGTNVNFYLGTNLWLAISAEASSRAAGDAAARTNLQASIDAEALLRAAGDAVARTNLQASIDAEALLRAVGDAVARTNLQAVITAGDAAERVALVASGGVWRAEWRSAAGATGDVIRAQALAALASSGGVWRAEWRSAAGATGDTIRAQALAALASSGGVWRAEWRSTAGATGDVIRAQALAALAASGGVWRAEWQTPGDAYRVIDPSSTTGWVAVADGTPRWYRVEPYLNTNGIVLATETGLSGHNNVVPPGTTQTLWGVWDMSGWIATNIPAAWTYCDSVGYNPVDGGWSIYGPDVDEGGYWYADVGPLDLPAWLIVDPLQTEGGGSGTVSFAVGYVTNAYPLTSLEQATNIAAALAGSTNVQHIAADDPHGDRAYAEALASPVWQTIALAGTNCTVSPSNGGAQRVGLTNAAATVVFSGWDSSRLQGVLFEFATGGTNYALTWPGTVVWASSIDVTSNRTYWVNLMNRGGSGYVAQPIVSW